MMWSEQTWKLAEPIYYGILRHPFVRELADGTLDSERFMFYLQQDAIYIDNYCRVLAHIASRLKAKDDIDAFLRFASEGIMVEHALHESFLCGIDMNNVSPTPACMLYTSFETAQGLGPVEIEAAAILPCFWIYQKVGEHILASCNPGNPYIKWISTYGDKSFAEATDRAIAICNRLAGSTTPEIRARMTQAFILAARMEWMFWDSAYNLEQWKI